MHLDRRCFRKFGYAITRDVEEVKADSLMPEAKCNTVSFTKTEAVHPDCRHTIAVSEKYISYIIKGTLLRVISTVDSSKVLLRGHESHIMDAKFETDSGDWLCTVDAGTIADKHIFVWHIDNENSVPNELSFKLQFGYKLKSTFVIPRPANSAQWVVGYKNSIGLLDSISIQNANDLNCTTYSDLKYNYSFPQEITILGNILLILYYDLI